MQLMFSYLEVCAGKCRSNRLSVLAVSLNINTSDVQGIQYYEMPLPPPPSACSPLEVSLLSRAKITSSTPLAREKVSRSRFCHINLIVLHAGARRALLAEQMPNATAARSPKDCSCCEIVKKSPNHQRNGNQPTTSAPKESVIAQVYCGELPRLDKMQDQILP